MSTATFEPTEHPHRRRNALTGEWVLVSPHRTKRPWQGQVEKSAAAPRPGYDPRCYLSPGNKRAGGGVYLRAEGLTTIDARIDSCAFERLTGSTVDALAVGTGVLNLINQ